jgi:hypothetical protein
MAKTTGPELSITASLMVLLLGVAAVLAMAVYRNNTAKPRAPKQHAEKMSLEEAKAAADVFGKAFVIGRTMSRAGVLEPDGRQMDAIARVAQTEYGDTHSRQWFKSHFARGFWEGWESR